MATEKLISNRRERTAKTPTRCESQVLRTTASQIMAAPRMKVARRQCSIRLITPEAATPTPKSAMNTHCSQPGSGEGCKWTSWGFDTESMVAMVFPTPPRAFRPAPRCWRPRRSSQRANAAWVRRNKSGLVPHIRVHVAGKLAVYARYSHVQDGSAFFDHIRGKHVRLASGRDDDICGQGFCLKIFRSGVAQGHGGIFATTSQHQANGTAHGYSAADDNHLGAIDIDVVAAQPSNAATRGTGQRCLFVEHELAQVDRVQAISIFIRVNQFQDAVFIEVLRQRQLDDVSGDFVIGVELRDDCFQFFLRGIFWQILADGGNSQLFTIAVFHLHIRVRSRIFSYQNSREPWLFIQRGNPLFEVFK